MKANKEWHQLVLDNMEYARACALKVYRGKFSSKGRVASQILEEFESAANLGLCKAARAFDSSRKTKFSSFAYFYIHGNIIDFIRGELRATFGLTEYEKEKLERNGEVLPTRGKRRNTYARFQSDLLVERYNKSPYSIVERRDSLDRMWRTIENNFAPRVIEFFKLHHKQGLTYDQVAERNNITGTRVCQVLNQEAIPKLRAIL